MAFGGQTKPALMRVVLALCAAIFLAGAGIAAYHVGVEQGWWQGAASCSGPNLNTMTIDELREHLLQAPIVRCDEVAWSLFGVSMAGYNILASLALSGGCAWLARSLGGLEDDKVGGILGMLMGEKFLSLYRHIRRVAAVVILAVLTATPAVAIDAKAALKERAIGDPAAPVTMIEYASLTCPHCASFHNDTYKAFKERYIDSGKVRLIYRDFPLDGVALRAAMMARCTIGQRYFGLLQVLYQSQNKWARAKDPVAELAKIGRLAGIDQATFDACMTSEDLINGILKVRQKAAADGVRSTPTFVIGEKIHPGSRSLEEFAEIIEPLLKDK